MGMIIVSSRALSEESSPCHKVTKKEYYKKAWHVTDETFCGRFPWYVFVAKKNIRICLTKPKIAFEWEAVTCKKCLRMRKSE